MEFPYNSGLHPPTGYCACCNTVFNITVRHRDMPFYLKNTNDPDFFLRCLAKGYRDTEAGQQAFYESQLGRLQRWLEDSHGNGGLASVRLLVSRPSLCRILQADHGVGRSVVPQMIRSDTQLTCLPHGQRLLVCRASLSATRNSSSGS